MVTYSEILVGTIRTHTVEALDELLMRFPMRRWPVTEAVALAAARLRVRNPFLKLPDALILATGEVVGADAILTADRRWAKVTSLARLIQA